MDAWSSEQLKKMQLGGNDALNNFLKKYGIDKHTDIKEKYNSSAAEVPAALCTQTHTRAQKQHTQAPRLASTATRRHVPLYLGATVLHVCPSASTAHAAGFPMHH